jgi:hypothetical protein
LQSLRSLDMLGQPFHISYMTVFDSHTALG